MVERSDKGESLEEREMILDDMHAQGPLTVESNADDHEPYRSIFLNEELIPYEDARVDAWGLINYEGGKFIWKILEKRNGEINVNCLEKPFGINESQEFEHGENSFISRYTKLISLIKPKLMLTVRKPEMVLDLQTRSHDV